ncbi:hypothetical protein BO70DRAFT_164214 [Aspergillus heteromorphus CBS 117.55]|uniref:Uncharacterized protein n=1 Tax=Aspergillus heteromorphus CBS 117.55 TaxID=1448321 RepID=A0A317WS40_9EURO|nr:uncharacterized protein BO70DRAFT_164214 [Aspergillus heteromorphus CBS 117.55]PWY89266.1 hypothetical protein BO70DRAFT_164214 [Aspergillus heteromorphus CBS 117.55]
MRWRTKTKKRMMITKTRSNRSALFTDPGSRVYWFTTLFCCLPENQILWKSGGRYCSGRSWIVTQELIVRV